MDELKAAIRKERKAMWEGIRASRQRVKRYKLLMKQQRTAQKISSLAETQFINVVHIPSTHSITVRSA